MHGSLPTPRLVVQSKAPVGSMHAHHWHQPRAVDPGVPAEPTGKLLPCWPSLDSAGAFWVGGRRRDGAEGGTSGEQGQWAGPTWLGCSAGQAPCLHLIALWNLLAMNAYGFYVICMHALKIKPCIEMVTWKHITIPAV